MKTSLSKGIRLVLIANIINLGFNLVANFLLPKYLPVVSYSEIKTFQLYLSYIGVFHFGFIDGIYLQYGGRNLDTIARNQLKLCLNTFRVFQLVISVIGTIVSLLLKDNILLFVSLAVLPYNTTMLLKQLYQATGEFRLYGKVMNYTTVSTFAVNIVLLMIFHCSKSNLYIISYLIIYLLIWLILENGFANFQISEHTKLFSWKLLVETIYDGFLLMLGNFASIFQTGLDRWFVKALMDNIAFAQYSFAVSMESILNVAVAPITITMYNYFCVHNEKEDVSRICKGIIIFACGIVACAFPAKFILEYFLKSYLPSSGVLFLLFGAQIFYIINKSAFVNLYKAKRKQRAYFIKLVIVIVIGFLLNILIYGIFRHKEAFAIGTLITSIVWFVVNLSDFPETGIGLKECTFLGIEIILFLCCGYLLNSVLGGIVYCVGSILLSYIFLRETVNFYCGMLVKKSHR